MKFLFISFCIIFGAFVTGDCVRELKNEKYGAFGLQLMASIVTVALILKIIFM